jgi:hypothetical protein
MHQAADARDMADFIDSLLKHTMDKYVTGKQRLDHPHHPAPGCPFHPQSRMKYVQTQILAQVSRGDVFMLRLRSGTIPRWIWVLHQDRNHK